jgi:hypothetical protein
MAIQEGTARGCFICDKHDQADAAQGGVLYEDELVKGRFIVEALERPRDQRLAWRILNALGGAD